MRRNNSTGTGAPLPASNYFLGNARATGWTPIYLNSRNKKARGVKNISNVGVADQVTVSQILNWVKAQGLNVTPSEISNGLNHAHQKKQQDETMGIIPNCGCGAGKGWCIWSHTFGNGGTVGVCLGEHTGIHYNK